MYCIWCSALGVVAVVLRSWCALCVSLYPAMDTNLHTVHKTTHRLLRTTATTPSTEHHMQQHTICTPEDGI